MVVSFLNDYLVNTAVGVVLLGMIAGFLYDKIKNFLRGKNPND